MEKPTAKTRGGRDFFFSASLRLRGDPSPGAGPFEPPRGPPAPPAAAGPIRPFHRDAAPVKARCISAASWNRSLASKASDLSITAANAGGRLERRRIGTAFSRRTTSTGSLAAPAAGWSPKHPIERGCEAPNVAHRPGVPEVGQLLARMNFVCAADGPGERHP